MPPVFRGPIWLITNQSGPRSARRADRRLAMTLTPPVRFWAHPAVWGEGSRLYEGEALRMRLLGSTSFDSGVTMLRYEPLRQ
jgi:hypothetical protein